MDTKRLITAIILGLGLIVIYFGVLNWLDKKNVWNLPPAPPPGSIAQATQPAGVPSSQAVTEGPSSTTGPNSLPPNISAGTAHAASMHVVPATQPGLNPAPSLLGSQQHKDSQFALQIDIQPLGAGLASVILNDFKKTAKGKEPYIFQLPLPGRLDTEPLGSRNITLDGVTYDLAGVPWNLTASTATSVTYSADLVDAGKAIVHLTKTYQVLPRSDAGEGYEIGVQYGFRNATDHVQTIQTEFNGPTLPPPETNRPPDRQAVAGYADKGQTIEVDSHPIEKFMPDKDNGEIALLKVDLNSATGMELDRLPGIDPRLAEAIIKNRPYAKTDDLARAGLSAYQIAMLRPLVAGSTETAHKTRWAGAVSNYFGAVVLPEDLLIDGKPTNADYLSSIVAHGVNIDKDVPGDDHLAYITFQTKEISLAAGKSAVIPLSVYFGPKWRNVLDAAHYAASPRHYDQLDVMVTSMCGMSFCSFQWLDGAIGWLLRFLHDYVLHDWGLAIIGLVAIVRILLHPITRRSQISMSKMSKMGPEMERLRKKYADDKDALNKAMVEFHREQGLGPYLGCLPMFLQMPIWIALYAVLQNTFELRQAPFLWNWTWIHDLAQPDYLYKFPHPVHVLFFDLDAINLLPVLLSIVMFIQQQFMPKPVAASADQLKQQKMMQWLSPVMFLFFFYKYQSGLNLYIFTSTGVGIIESKVVRDHLKAREEAEKAGRVFIPTKATRASKQGDPRQKDEPPKRRGPVGWLGEFWGKLLEQAEDVRRQQNEKGNNKRK
jgi:YidC/Oxa1 family membrane protein insertase